jgi:hypothetical protein
MKRFKLLAIIALAISSLCAVQFGTSAVAQTQPVEGAVAATPVFAQAPSPAAALENPILEPAPALETPTYQPVPRWQGLFTPAVWAALFGILSMALTYPLTGALKAVFQTDGITTVTVNAGLNTFFAGLLPWFIGVYPPTLEALFYVVLSTGLGMFMDKITHVTVRQNARGSGL